MKTLIIILLFCSVSHAENSINKLTSAELYKRIMVCLDYDPDATDPQNVEGFKEYIQECILKQDIKYTKKD